MTVSHSASLDPLQNVQNPSKHKCFIPFCISSKIVSARLFAHFLWLLTAINHAFLLRNHLGIKSATLTVQTTYSHAAAQVQRTIKYYLLLPCTQKFLYQKSKLKTVCTQLNLSLYPAVSFLHTFATSLFSFHFLPLDMCKKTPLARSPRLPSPAATTTQSNSKSHFTAAISYLATRNTRNLGRVEMLLTCLAHSLRVFEKAASTSHGEGFINILSETCFDIDLFKKRVKKQNIVAFSR